MRETAMIVIGAVWLSAIIAAIAFPPLTLAACAVSLVCLMVSVGLRQ